VTTTSNINTVCSGQLVPKLRLRSGSTAFRLRTRLPHCPSSHLRPLSHTAFPPSSHLPLSVRPPQRRQAEATNERARQDTVGRSACLLALPVYLVELHLLLRCCILPFTACLYTIACLLRPLRIYLTCRLVAVYVLRWTLGYFTVTTVNIYLFTLRLLTLLAVDSRLSSRSGSLLHVDSSCRSRLTSTSRLCCLVSPFTSLFGFGITFWPCLCTIVLHHRGYLMPRYVMTFSHGCVRLRSLPAPIYCAVTLYRWIIIVSDSFFTFVLIWELIVCCCVFLYIILRVNHKICDSLLCYYCDGWYIT